MRPGKFADLAFERDGPAAVPLAHFQAEQIVAPPGRLGRVRMLAAAGDRDQTAAAKQQQIAVEDGMPARRRVGRIC